MTGNSSDPQAEHLDWSTRWNNWLNERAAKNDLVNYVWRQKIRIMRVADELNTTPAGLKFRPEQRFCLEQLRGQLELLGLVPCAATSGPLDNDALRLVEAAKKSGAKTRTELSRQKPCLYKEITAHSQKEIIFAHLEMQKGLRHLSDAEIVASCEAFHSLTDLKRGNDKLHREVLARGLRDFVVKTHAWYTYGYIDVNGVQYRSRIELIFANLLLANEIRFLYDGIVPGLNRKSGEKPWRYDFYLLDHDRYVELLHNETPGLALGKTRRRLYLENRSQKLAYYASSHLRVCWIETEPFSVHDREKAFVEHCVALLSPQLQRELTVPALQALCYNGAYDLSAMSAEEILSSLLKDCRGIADYQNRYSTLRHILKSHPFYAQIEQEIRRRGQEERIKAVAKHRTERNSALCAIIRPGNLSAAQA